MIVENFRKKMNRAGFNPPFEIKADGNFHRFLPTGNLMMMLGGMF